MRGVQYTTESFLLKAVEIQGDKYDYSKVKYINIRTPIIITCPELFTADILNLDNREAI